MTPAKRLSKEQFDKANFIGSFREIKRKTAITPVYMFEGGAYDIMGNKIDLAKYERNDK